MRRTHRATRRSGDYHRRLRIEPLEVRSLLTLTLVPAGQAPPGAENAVSAPPTSLATPAAAAGGFPDSAGGDASTGVTTATLPTSGNLQPADAPVAQDDSYTVKENEALDERSSVTQLDMVSQPGDPIGGGLTYSYDDSTYVFSVSRNSQNGVSLSVYTTTTGLPGGIVVLNFGWQLNFAAPGGAALAPGTYSGAQQYPSEPADAPGIGICGGGLLLGGQLTGQFTVNDVEYDASGNVLQFDASFEQYAGNATAALTGRIQYHEPAPGSVSVLANDSSPDGNPLTAVLVAGPQDGTLTLESDGGFLYAPNAGFTGADSFQYQAEDGTALSNVATVTLNVIPFHHAPVGTSATISVPAGPSYALRAADFGFTDPADSPPDTFTAVEITTLPASGSLALSGTPVTAGQFVSVADLAAGNLVFTPASGGGAPAASAGRGSFTFQVEDSGSTANGGANLDPLPKTLTINFIPVAQDESYSIDENQTLDQAFLGNHLRLTYTYPWSSQSYTTDVDGSARPPSVTMNGDGVTFTYPPATGFAFPSHTVQFAAAGNTPLAPGLYSDAQATVDASHPGLSVDASQLGLSTPTRQFTVIEAVYGPAGDIERFDATFVLQDPTTGYSLAGHIQYNASAIEGTSVLQNDSDEDGDPLSATLVSGPQHGNLTFDRDGGFVYVPDQNFSGTDSFQYQASDGTALSNVATVTIDVAHVSQAPVGTSTTLTPPPGTPYVLQAADFGFSDPNDSPPDAFTAVEITTLPTWGSLALAGAPVAAGQFVSVADLAAGNLVFTPSSETGRTTRASFTFQVEDSGSTANGGVNLDPVPKTLTFNVAPVARDDAYAINENTSTMPGSPGVLQNDSDADGDPLTAVVVAGPQHGSLTLYPSGGFIYTPDTDFYGTDTFQYQASDGTALSNVATVTIAVLKVSQAPSGTSATVNIPPAAPYALQIADFGFSDVHDNPPDSFTAVEITTLPTAGSLALAGAAVAAGQFVSVADLAAGTLVFTPPVLAPGTPHASFTFQVEDSGSTAGGGANLDPDPKTLTFNTISVAQDGSYSVNENAVLDESIDETRLQVATVNAPYGESGSCDFGLEAATFTASRNSWGGVTVYTTSLDGQGEWYLTFGGWFGGAPGPGTYTDASPAPIYPSRPAYSPYLGVSGGAWSLAGEDAGGSFTVNQAVYGPSGEVEQFDVTFDQSASWSGPELAGRLQFHASTPGAVSVLANDSDDDGDPLTASLVSGPLHGSLSLDPGGGFIYTPNADFWGVDSFQYQASDGTAVGNVATVTINVNRVSQPPSGTSSTVTLPPGTAYMIKPADFGFTDPHDNPPYDFTGVEIDNPPASGSLTLAGAPVAAGQFIAVADIAAGELVFDMPADGPRPSIAFQVEDSGSTANGGVTVDPDPKTLSFNIAPVAVDDTCSVDENATIDCTSSVTSFWTNSQPGDPVGGGGGCSYTSANAGFSPEGYSRNEVSIDVFPDLESEWWNLTFAAPDGADLVPGTYAGAMYEATVDHPCVNVSTATNRPWATAGQFTVNQVVYDASGNLLRFDATFTQYADGSPAALSGRISYNSQFDLPAGVLLNDQDANGDPLSAVLVSGPQHGTLSLDPNGGFVYRPNQYFFGTDSFQYQADDGCALSNVADVSINVLRASQAPTGTSSVICVPAGAPYVLKPAAFGFSDPHDSPPDQFTAVEITSLPQRGSLTLGGVPVTAGQFVSVKDLAAGRLEFHPPTSCGSACGWRSYFYFEVEDSGSTANGGAVLDPSGKTLTFDVIPVAANVACTVNENGSLDASRYTASLTLSTTDSSGNSIALQFDQNNASFTATQGAYWSPLTVVCSSGSGQWTLNFGPGIGGPLWPGLFATALGVQTYTRPYMLIYKNGNVPWDPDHVFGQFTVNSVVYGPAFEVLELDATFQQSYWMGPVSGHIHYQAASVLNSASDADGDSLTAELVAAPKHGAFQLNANGTFDYAPNADFHGTDTFQYRVSDGTAQSNVATATITVNRVSQAPSGRDTVVVVTPGSPYTVKVADFGFSDPNDSPPDRFIAVEITSLPARGSLTLAGVAVAAGQFVSVQDLVAGRLLFHPPAASKAGGGRADFLFQVKDSGSTSRGGVVLDPTPKTLTFDVAPVAVPDSFTVNENATLNVPAVAGVLRNDTDADGDPLAAVLTSGPQHGTLALAPDGGFLYTPNPNFCGWDAFQYEASDGTADSTVATVSIYVRPVIGPPSGTDKSITMAANTTYTLGLGDFGFKSGFDPGGQVLGGSRGHRGAIVPPPAFSAVSITTLPAAGSLALARVPLTAGQVVSAGSISKGLLTFTPAANARGTPYASFAFQVQDNGGTANGRLDMDPTPKTMTFNVTATRVTAGKATAGSLSAKRLVPGDVPGSPRKP
ncbi:MAG: Ig-like domain-containing protein [Thermoguttaceae bacterium]|jgi:hypothetical protein